MSFFKSVLKSSESFESKLPEWLTNITERSSESVVSSAESVASSVSWTVENRGGLAKLTGMLMVPSQFMGPDVGEVNRIINDVIMGDNHGVKVERLNFDHPEIHGVILYPHTYDKSNMDQCVVYHNPNGCTVPRFLSYGLESDCTPFQILRLRNCPVIMYDYLGTGMSREESSIPFRPTYESVVKDGVLVLRWAKERFQLVECWGSSLGGGVATVATERFLTLKPENNRQVTLTNHDSFTTTGRVVLPKKVASVARVVGDLNAEKSMKKLVQYNIRIIVLCHDRDPVIPEGARMAELEELRNRENVKVIHSPEYGHANLSRDMINSLL